MSRNSLIGRDHEISLLNKIYQSKSPELVAIYGRRRIGKTYLVSNYFCDKGVYLEFTGSKNANRGTQIKNFYRECANVFPEFNINMPSITDWTDALHELKEKITALNTTEKIILFFDELPWLASPRSGFLSAFEYIWNRHFSRMNNLLVIVCGSAASWMINNIVNDKEGFYGRLSKCIPMQAFDLRQTEDFLKNKNIDLPRRQLVQLYMTTGGVAKYLTYLEKNKSVTQMIDDLFFNAKGQLFIEFLRLYRSLFNDSEKHLAIVRALSQKRYGLNQKTLLDLAKLPQSGTSTTVLSELEASGFIMSLPQFGKKTKNKIYRLVDEYSYFYLDWVEPKTSDILNASNLQYWQQQQFSQAWIPWAGYTFETICLKHILQIKKALGILNVNTSISHLSIKNSALGGTEIDLILERADKIIHLFEIKFSNDVFVISKPYAEQLNRKKEIFREFTGTKHAILLTMITPYGVKENNEYHAVVNQQLTLDDLFLEL